MELAIIIGTYGLAMFVVGVISVEVSGFFPSHARTNALRGTIGNFLVIVLSLTLVGLVMATLWLGINKLSWPIMVIAGGLAFLGAPLAFQLISSGFWDSKTGACVGILVTGATLVLLFRAHAW